MNYRIYADVVGCPSFYITCFDDSKVQGILNSHGIFVFIIRNNLISLFDDKPGAENRVFAAAETIRAFFGLNQIYVDYGPNTHVIQAICLT